MSLQDDFPNLNAEGYSQTSPATPDYNCIAWAAGRQDDWLWPDPALDANSSRNDQTSQSISMISILLLLILFAALAYLCYLAIW